MLGREALFVRLQGLSSEANLLWGSLLKIGAHRVEYCLSTLALHPLAAMTARTAHATAVVDRDAAASISYSPVNTASQVHGHCDC